MLSSIRREARLFTEERGIEADAHLFYFIFCNLLVDLAPIGNILHHQDFRAVYR